MRTLICCIAFTSVRVVSGRPIQYDNHKAYGPVNSYTSDDDNWLSDDAWTIDWSVDDDDGWNLDVPPDSDALPCMLGYTYKEIELPEEYSRDYSLWAMECSALCGSTPFCAHALVQWPQIKCFVAFENKYAISIFY